MFRSRLLAVILIAAGTLALIYGQVTYTTETHDVDLGVVEMQFKEKDTINLPAWSGAGAIGLGALLLLFRRR